MTYKISPYTPFIEIPILKKVIPNQKFRKGKQKVRRPRLTTILIRYDASKISDNILLPKFLIGCSIIITSTPNGKNLFYDLYQSSVNSNK